ncbi:shikimate kinase [Caldimonas tepidiphila]|uniref:shikimate kinase n=1 Tax=Caldimonas tepidiphila TaxID=2315841 RepID=UPI001F0CA0CA|nr:shikimate kinase [Caldimonas tepidiphila]
MYPTHISLVGMPGAGKTSIGRRLARELGLPFHDSDCEIERYIGGSIRDFFEAQGEDAFRELEQRVVAELAGGAACVLATGGGTVLRAANRERLKAAGTVVYLHATPEALFRRLRQDTRRPLLQVADPLQRLRELFRQRDRLYRETAHDVIDTGHASVGRAVHELLARFEPCRTATAAAES